MIKCELIIGGYSYKITDDVMNWDDVTISLKRGNYDGVSRSFSSKFEFVNTAYALLKKQYQDNYLGAAASIVISRRNNSWTWNELFRCTLDFSTYADDGRVIAINAVDNTLAAIIKSKKSIQYEYLVSSLESETLSYDRLNMQSKYQYVPYQTDNEKDNQGEYDLDESSEFPAKMRQNLTFPLLYTTTETTKEADKIVEIKYIYSLFPDKENEYSNDYIFKNRSKDKDIKIKIAYDFRVTSLNGKQVGMFLLVWRPGEDGKSETIESHTLFPPLSTIRINGTRNMTVPPGCYFVFCFQKKSAWDELKVRISDFNVFSISLDTIGEPANIDIIPLNILANKLISSMTGEDSPYGAVIANYLPDMRVNRLSNTYIMAAESARGLPKAKLYTSFKKFTDFMETEFGYVPVIKGNTVEFEPRYDLYIDLVEKDLGSAVNDYQYSVNSSLIYSSVKVGYDKQDYDSINGRDEFRFTNEFSTGLTLTENTFSLLSPYRADAYGIEFLVQKRGEDTTDSDSDNDTFIVGCIRDGLKYILKRNYTPSLLKGMISPETMFNIEYSPRFMLDANKSYIGACTNHLKFTSSNGNSDISIDGIKETDDLVIDSPLFTVGEIEVETSDTEVQDELNKLVSLTYNGSTATGYIKQLKINVGKEESVKYSLIVKDIKK